jgi:hypothetical protein
MFEIDKTLVSDEIFTESFCCNLAKCKGCCCIEGDAGAPLESQELQLLEKHFPIFKKYMSVEGLLAVSALGRLWDTQENQVGISEVSAQSAAASHLVTPIINGSDCVYLYKDADGISKCAIEKAWAQGEIDFQKPISCHLFPIRITAHENYDAINFFHWHICNDAIIKGREEEIPVFRFLKEPLIRKYGEAWYEQAEEIYKILCLNLR